MWLLDVLSPRSDAECRGGARQERFETKATRRDECAFTRSQHRFHSAVGDLVCICFVATCRYDLLVRER